MWDIAELYKNAWSIVKKNKFLWIFGVATGGTSMGFRSFQDFQPGKMQDMQKLFDTPHSSSPLNKVLGATTIPPHETFLQMLQHVPLGLYILLVCEILFFIGVAILVGVLYKAWATGLQLEGIEAGIRGEVVTIEHNAQKAFGHIPSLIWLSIIPWLGVMLGTFAYVTLISILMFFLPTLMVVTIPLLVIGIVAAFIIGIRLMLSSIWAPRLVITHHLKGYDALKKGYEMTKGRFWPMILLGIVNVIVSLVVMILPFALLALVLSPVIFLITKEHMTLFLGLIPVGVILGIAVLFGFTLLGGIVASFKATVWSLAYKTIQKS